MEAAAIARGIRRRLVRILQGLDADIQHVHHGGGELCLHGLARDKDRVLRAGGCVRGRVRRRQRIHDGECKLVGGHGEEILIGRVEVVLLHGLRLQHVLEAVAEQNVVLLCLSAGVEVLKVELPSDCAEAAARRVIGGVDEEGRLCADLLVEHQLPHGEARPHGAQPLVAKRPRVRAKGAVQGHEDAAKASIRHGVGADRHGENGAPDAAAAAAHSPEELWIAAATGDLLVDDGLAVGVAADLQDLNL